MMLPFSRSLICMVAWVGDDALSENESENELFRKKVFQSPGLLFFSSHKAKKKMGKKPKDFSAWDVRDEDEARMRRDQAKTYYYIQAGEAKTKITVPKIWMSIFIFMVLNGIVQFEVNETTCLSPSAFLFVNWPIISDVLKNVGAMILLMILSKILFVIAHSATRDEDFPSPSLFWKDRKAE